MCLNMSKGGASANGDKYKAYGDGLGAGKWDKDDKLTRLKYEYEVQETHEV